MSYWGANILSQRLNKILNISSKNDTMLDFGCGQGAYTSYLNSNGYKIIGTDILKYNEWDGNEFFEHVDVLPLPFKDNQFDIVFCFEVLEHCKNYISILKELRRVCKRDFIMSVPNCDLSISLRGANLVPAHWTDQTHCNFFKKESIKDVLEQNNFMINSIEDCLEISVSEYFWKTLRVPKLLQKIGAKLTRDFNLSPIFYSSILIHCSKVLKDD